MIKLRTVAFAKHSWAGMSIEASQLEEKILRIQAVSCDCCAWRPCSAPQGGQDRTVQGLGFGTH